MHNTNVRTEHLITFYLKVSPVDMSVLTTRYNGLFLYKKTLLRDVFVCIWSHFEELNLCIFFQECMKGIKLDYICIYYFKQDILYHVLFILVLIYLCEHL